MKNILLAIIFLPILTYCQSSKTYLELIDDAKTKKSAEQIEKLIIGTWEFEKLTDSNGKIISEITHFINDTITANEVIWRPSMRIEKNGTYELIGYTIDINEHKKIKRLDYLVFNPIQDGDGSYVLTQKTIKLKE